LNYRLFADQLQNGLKKLISSQFYCISILSSLSIFSSILIITMCLPHFYPPEHAAARLPSNTSVTIWTKVPKENTKTSLGAYFGLSSQTVLDESTNYLTYQNPTLGVKIRYPITWIKNETRINQIFVTFDSPQIDSKGYNTAEIKLGIDTTPTSINLTEYLNNEKETYRDNKNFTNFQVIKNSVNSYIAGQPAYSLVFTYTSSSSHINYVVIETGTVVNNSKVDWIYVLIEADHYSNYLPIVEKMINSFKFVDHGQMAQQALSYHDTFQNGTDLVHFPTNTIWIYPFRVPDGAVNISLNATFRSINGHSINATLVDAAKCGHHTQGGEVENIRTCSQFLIKKTMSAGSLMQGFLVPGKLYNIILEDDISHSNRFKTYFVLDYQREFLDYVNYAKYGIRTLYPYNWEIAEENGGVRFLAPFKNNTLPFQDNVFIKCYNLLPAEEINQDKLAESDVYAYKQVTKDFKLFDSNKFGLVNTNTSAYRLVFTYTDGKITFKTTQISMIKNNKLYRITYTAIPQTYLNYFPFIQNMIDSFKPVFLVPYRNSAIGLNNLLYPSDWQKSERQNQVSFYPPVEAINNNTDSVLQVHMVPTLGHVLEDFVSTDINYYKQGIAGFELNDSIPTNVAGYHAYEIQYAYRNVNLQKQYKEIQVYTVVGNLGYIISYIEEPNRYYNYLDAMKQMLTTLKIQNTNGVQVDKPGVKMANHPNGISINPTTHTMYVTNGASDTVSVINTKTNRILSNISVGATPNDVDINTADKILYVANLGSNTVSIIDTLTNKVISNTIVGRTPAAIRGDPNDEFLFTANRDSDTVSVINTENYQWLLNIGVGTLPVGLAVNTVTHTLYVVNSGSNTISIINYYSEIAGHSFRLSRPIETVNVGETPDGIAINPVTNKIYVSNGYTNTISVIDGKTNSVVKNIPVGTAPMRLAVNPTTNII
jgi:YVTN family beta-propeller protein